MRTFNPYYIAFWVLYKFIKLTTPDKIKDVIPESTHNLYLFCLTNNILTLFLIVNPTRNIKISYFLLLLLFGILMFLVSQFNKYLFLKSDKYLRIESDFDAKYKLSKGTLILLAILYMTSSIAFMVICGIYLY